MPEGRRRQYGLGVSRWRRPDEHILWSGYRHRRLMADEVLYFVQPLAPLLLIPPLVALATSVRRVLSNNDPRLALLALLLVVVVLGVVGAWVVRGARARWGTWYVITDQRAAVVTHGGKRVSEVPRSASMVIRRSPNGRRGSVWWGLPGPVQPSIDSPGYTQWVGRPGSALAGGVGSPGQALGDLAFLDVADIDGLVAAALQAGFARAQFVPPPPGAPAPSGRSSPAAPPSAPTFPPRAGSSPAP